MKVKKLLAGLSAAALAASMLSMVSFAEGEEATPKFLMQVHAQNNADGDWAWASNDGAFEGGSVTVTGNSSALLANKDKSDLANAGLHFKVSNANDFELKTVIKAKISYKIESEAGTFEDDDYAFEATVNKPEWDTNYNADVMIPLFEDWDKVAALGDYTATATVSDIEVVPYVAPEAEIPESEYNTVEAVTAADYAGDWAGDGLYTPKLDRIVAEDGMVVTVKYSLAPAEKSSKQNENGEFYWDQNAFAPMDQHNWKKLGDEWEFSQDGWEVDPTITKATVNENKDKEAFEAERDAAEGPFMKKDGFVLVKEDGELTFKLNEKMIKELQARAEENKGEDGSIWYGLGFQVYGVILDQVTYEYNTTAVDKFTVNGDVSFNQSVKIDPAEYGVTADSDFSKIKIGLKGITVTDKGIEDGDTEHSYWNDWCTYKIKITKADGTVAYAAVIGDQVSWPTTVDDNGTPDNDEDNIVIDVADCVKAEAGTGKAVVELDYEFGDTYEVIALGWDGFPDDPYINVVGVAFDDAEIDWPAEPAPEESTPDESTPESTTESTPESTTESTPESKTESKPGNSGNNGGKNANTGAVALGLGVLTLAGAAVVVTKKKF